MNTLLRVIYTWKSFEVLQEENIRDREENSRSIGKDIENTLSFGSEERTRGIERMILIRNIFRLLKHTVTKKIRLRLIILQKLTY